MTVNVGLVRSPEDCDTRMAPVTAPDGTVTVIWVVVKLPAARALPANVTARGAAKFAPLITTVDPTAPLVGERLQMAGALDPVAHAAGDATTVGVGVGVGVADAPGAALGFALGVTVGTGDGGAAIE